MIVAHNITAINAQRQFNITDRTRAKSVEKLSSGYKINRAADDAAGLAISEKMRRQIRGLTQGATNTQDGVSMCQVGDGALSEVSDMLHRMTELAVKAANGTMDPADRHAVQLEINQILEEIDKIGNNTDFNGIPLFRGDDKVLRNPDGSPFMESTIPFADFSLADVSLGVTPLQGMKGNTPALKAVVTNPSSPAYNKSYSLIYDHSATSKSSIRVTRPGEAPAEIYLKSFTGGTVAHPDTNTWTKTLTYNQNGYDISWEQTVKTSESGDNKDYIVEYKFINNSSETINIDYMFHADTAYNNDDQCEGYFIGGNRVNRYTVYANASSATVPSTENSANPNVVYGSNPTSFSIVDVDKALPFSESISMVSGQEPDVISIGDYSDIYKWSYYSQSELSSHLGHSSSRSDLGFSLIWENKTLAAGGGDFTTSFRYGIRPTERDANLAGVPVNHTDDAATIHNGKKPIWIQSGTEVGDGMFLNFGEMNARVLQLEACDVETEEAATDAIDQCKYALSYVSNVRSEIGAQQNRLEHTINNVNNIVENTTAAESKIRDTDMASEMVKMSLQNILSQSGIAMMTQANQSNEGVLALLG